MSNLNEKLATAKSTYETARANLDNARSEYENGAGKNYAEIKKNIAALKAQLDEYQRAHLAAKQAFADAMKESKAKRTPKVNDAMNEVRNIESLAEECQAILGLAECSASIMREEASVAAEAYLAAYKSAAQAWAEMNVLVVLAECGVRLCAAMAVCPVGISDDEYVRVNLNQRTPGSFLLSELEKIVDSYDGDKKPYIAEIGDFDLGTMSLDEIMTPAQLHQARVKNSPVTPRQDDIAQHASPW